MTTGGLPREFGMLRCLCFCALAWCCSGCAQAAREAAREATPAAVEGAVEEVEDPGTRHDIARILEDPRILKATSEVAESVTEGVVDGLFAEQHAKRFEELNAELVQAFMAAFAESLREEMAPALAEVVAETTDQTLERATSPEVERRLEELVRTAMRGGVEGIGQAIQDSNGELSLAVSRMARDAGRGAALGINDAVHQQVEREGPGGDGLLSDVGEVADATADGLSVLAIGLGVLAALILLGVLWMIFRLRRQLDRISGQLGQQPVAPRDLSGR